MNALQKKELEILKAFVEVCAQLNLRYFLVCGSALGAKKYNGFIPWDDDIDVGMFREDYERFASEAQELLPDYLFFQSFKTDPAYPQIFGKLRDSRTTFIEKTAAALPINHGVYIDIFPLDGYPATRLAQYHLEARKRCYKSLLSCAFDTERSGWNKVVYYLAQLFRYQKRSAKIAERYEKMIKRYPLTGSKLICNHGNWQDKLEYAPSEQYGNGIQAKFEGLDVYLPEKTDDYLTQKYGKWREELPEDQKEPHHYAVIVDLEKSYKEYFESAYD